MEEFLVSILDLIIAVWSVLSAAFSMLLPWMPLFAWIGFWLCAVDWVKLRTVLLQGGWTGFALTWFVAVLVWGVVAPPPDGTHHLFGLTVGNFVGKAVYMSALYCIMALCGMVQLSGAWSCCRPAVTDGSADAPAAH